MQVDQTEIAPGLVVTLDTAVLRALGGCRTNATRTPQADRAITGVSDFLITGVDQASATCTAVPLFSKTAVGNQPLDAGRKTGGDQQWIGAPSFFSRWQHWRIPLAAVAGASGPDESLPAMRRRYSADDVTALDDIRHWEKLNRGPYRDA